MPKREFTEEFLKEVLWDDADGAKVLSDEVTSSGRWAAYHDLVFSFEGASWLVKYQRGLTEVQDDRPEFDSCIAVQVHPVPKTVMVYEPLPEPQEG